MKCKVLEAGNGSLILSYEDVTAAKIRSYIADPCPEELDEEEAEQFVKDQNAKRAEFVREAKKDPFQVGDEVLVSLVSE